jgi:nucleotide-binding universal stress UspA family protein
VPVRILAAVDYSETATLVVEEAAALARQKHAAQLHFLHVNDLFVSAEEQEMRHAELLEWLEPRLKGAADIGKTRVIAHEESGDPARLILEMASDLSVETVVVGTRDRKGVQRLLLGSVASEVVQKCGCAVFVVRPKHQQSAVIPLEPPCPDCVAARAQSGGEAFWCEHHAQRHGRRHTYYDPRAASWASQRIVS